VTRVKPFPRVSFGIIVLNGEPFTRYCLQALYPFAHEIIVVEGAAPGAANVATPDGHSMDATLETIQRFINEEDPQQKVQLVTRDGFWSEKDEMSQAYAVRATGDYLWQVDVDEFYKAEDMQKVLDILQREPSITAVSFKMLTFWGGFDYLCDGWYLQSGAEIYHRLFKWGSGYSYVTHRPPTVHDEHGRDLRTLTWLDGYTLARKYGILMYHYSLVFPKQVSNKTTYYSHAAWASVPKSEDWAEMNYIGLKHPYRLHNVYQYPGWIKRFKGHQPNVITRLRLDLDNGVLKEPTRRTDDIELLLKSPTYAIGRTFYQFVYYGYRFYRWGLRRTPATFKMRLKSLLRRRHEYPVRQHP
jgi:hypothetical protein